MLGAHADLPSCCAAVTESLLDAADRLFQHAAALQEHAGGGEGACIAASLTPHLAVIDIPDLGGPDSAALAGAPAELLDALREAAPPLRRALAAAAPAGDWALRVRLIQARAAHGQVPWGAPVAPERPQRRPAAALLAASRGGPGLQVRHSRGAVWAPCPSPGAMLVPGGAECRAVHLPPGRLAAVVAELRQRGNEEPSPLAAGAPHSRGGVWWSADPNPFPDGRLARGHPWAWANVEAAPKEDHGTVALRGDWYKTMQWHLLHTGGFLRIATERGRAYWLAQNAAEHATPDWKLHFGVAVPDVPAAWDVLAALFMERRCEAGMKAITDLSPGGWPERQRGRELTVYIMQYHAAYGRGGPMEGLAPAGEEHSFYLGREFDSVYGDAFWASFVEEAERRFAGAGIRPSGCADGDLALPGCRYASLRNEAYVLCPGERVVLRDGSRREAELVQTLQYPPNSGGWNAAGHDNPIAGAVALLGRRSGQLSAEGARPRRLPRPGVLTAAAALGLCAAVAASPIFGRTAARGDAD